MGSHVTPSAAGLLRAPLAGMLDVWGELVEAYCGCNGFGSDTAEVYAYHLMPDDPRRRLGAPDGARDAEEEAARLASAAFHALLGTFADRYDCTVEIDGRPWAVDAPPATTGHRWHVRVTKREAPHGR